MAPRQHLQVVVSVTPKNNFFNFILPFNFDISKLNGNPLNIDGVMIHDSISFIYCCCGRSGINWQLVFG